MKKGISLIVLVITIIVIIILSGAVILSLSNNNPIVSATEASFKTSAEAYNSAVVLAVAKKYVDAIPAGSFNPVDFDALTWAGGVNPTANTIKEVIPNITDADALKYEVRDGKLLYVGSVASEITMLSAMGISNSTPAVLPVYTYNYTGSMQTLTIPAGVNKVRIEVWGGQGGQGGSGSAGGLGGYTVGEMTVTAGTTLYVYAGGAGSSGGSSTPGGWNGGGANGVNSGGGTSVGSGGGASDVRIGGTALTNRVIVAGGGGGGTLSKGVGGAGGGTNGQSIGGGGAGGTQTTGNALGIGGVGASNYDGGAGGGGGYYGGYGGAGVPNGGGWGYPGGGGSGYVGTLTNATTTLGINTGNGRCVITAIN